MNQPLTRRLLNEMSPHQLWLGDVNIINQSAVDLAE